MEVARAESDLAAEAANRWLARRRAGSARPTSFAGLPVAVQRRVVQLQLFQLKQTIDFELIEHLRTRPNQPVCASPGHCLARAADGRVRLREVAKTAFQTGSLRLKLGRRGAADFGRIKITWEIADEPGMKQARRPNLEQFDAEKVGAKVGLRHWRPGDRFWPIGATSAVKLQDLFTNLKVPRAERHRRVVAVTGRGRLFWVEGLRMAEDFKLEPTTVRRLKWAWRRAGARDKSQLRH